MWGFVLMFSLRGVSGLSSTVRDRDGSKAGLRTLLFFESLAFLRTALFPVWASPPVDRCQCAQKPGPSGFLRSAAVGLILVALAGCRLDISPEALDLTAEVGGTVQETLTLSNPGDDPVDYTLTPSGAGIALSSRSGQLNPGEQTDIEVSMTCDAAGPVSGTIRVRAATGNKSSIVEVPIALQCSSAQAVEPPVLVGGAGLVSIEVFQGPPVYKADFDTGRTHGPVAMARPENGAEPVEAVAWRSYQLDTQIHHRAWDPADEGLVTAIWRRQAAVAVAVRHADDFPVPGVSAAIERNDARTALSQIYQETVRDGEAFITDTVFYIERELYDRGAVLEVSVDSNAEIAQERLVLFGEEVMPLEVTWIPIVLEEIPEEAPIDPEAWLRDGQRAFLPIGDYKTGMGPTMVYEPTEEDGVNGHPPLHSITAVRQITDHRALHACGPQEIFYGVHNPLAMREAGYDSIPTGAASVFLLFSDNQDENVATIRMRKLMSRAWGGKR